MNQKNIFKKIAAVSLIVLFIIGCLLFWVELSSAWTPQTFCEQQSNSSLNEYTTCINYFNSLTSNQNYITETQLTNALNNYVTNTKYTSEYNDLKDDYYTKTEFTNQQLTTLNNYYTKTEQDNKFNSYYTKDQIDTNINNYKSNMDLQIKNQELTLITKFKDELKSGGWLTATVTTNLNQSDKDILENALTESEARDLYDEIWQRNPQSNISEDKTVIDMSTVIIIILVLLILAGLFYFVNKKNTTPTSSNFQVSNPVTDETIKLHETIRKQNADLSRLMQIVDEKDRKLIQVSAAIQEFRSDIKAPIEPPTPIK